MSSNFSERIRNSFSLKNFYGDSSSVPWVTTFYVFYVDSFKGNKELFREVVVHKRKATESDARKQFIQQEGSQMQYIKINDIIRESYYLAAPEDEYRKLRDRIKQCDENRLSLAAHKQSPSNTSSNKDTPTQSESEATSTQSDSFDQSKYRALRDPKNIEILKPLFKDSNILDYAGSKIYYKDGKVYIPKDTEAIQKLIAELKKSYKMFTGLNMNDFIGGDNMTNFSERIAKCFDKNFAADPNKFPGWITSGKYADDANNYYKSGPDSSLNKEQLKEIYKFLTDNIKKDFESRWWQFTVSPGSVSTSNKALKDVLLKVKKPVSVSVHIDITIMNSKIKVEATTNIHQCIPYGYTVMWLNHRKFFPQNESSIDQIMKLVEQAISKPEAKDELRCKGNNTSKLYDGKAAPKEV